MDMIVWVWRFKTKQKEMMQSRIKGLKSVRCLKGEKKKNAEVIALCSISDSANTENSLSECLLPEIVQVGPAFDAAHNMEKGESDSLKQGESGSPCDGLYKNMNYKKLPSEIIQMLNFGESDQSDESDDSDNDSDEEHNNLMAKLGDLHRSHVQTLQELGRFKSRKISQTSAIDEEEKDPDNFDDEGGAMTQGRLLDDSAGSRLHSVSVLSGRDLSGQTLQEGDGRKPDSIGTSEQPNIMTATSQGGVLGSILECSGTASGSVTSQTNLQVKPSPLLSAPSHETHGAAALENIQPTFEAPKFKPSTSERSDMKLEVTKTPAELEKELFEHSESTKRPSLPKPRRGTIVKAKPKNRNSVMGTTPKVEQVKSKPSIRRSRISAIIKAS